MIDRFVDRLVSVLVFGVFSDDGDAHFVLGVSQREQKIIPGFEFRWRGYDPKTFGDEFVEPVVPEGQGDFVDREIPIFLLDDRFDRDVAEQGYFLLFLARDTLFAAADEHIGLDADLAELTDRVLCWFGFDLCGGLEVWYQGQVDEQAVFSADVLWELANRFEERQAFDVPDGSSDFRDDDIGFGIG